MKEEQRNYLTMGSMIYAGLIFALSLMSILPELQKTNNLLQAIHGLFSTNFGLKIFLPFTGIFIVCFIMGPSLHRWMTRASVEGVKLDWARSKRIYTTMGILFLTLTAGMWGYFLATGGRMPLDQTVVLVTIWAAYAVFVIWRWFYKPDPDLVAIYTSGDTKRYNDERREFIQGQAARTVLKILIGILLTVGTLYEVIILRMWPVRTLMEIILVAFIWAFAHERWNARV